MLIHAKHYRTEEAIQVTLAGDVILDVSESDKPVDELPWIAPAFFDPQVNGYGGTWFSSETLTPHDALAALLPHFQFGLARMFPTLITASHDALASGLQAVRRACDMEPWANELVAGIHLEGPFISLEDGPRGAHQADHVRPADWAEFETLQEISGNRIRLVTLAPEVEGAIEFTGRATASGVAVAIGHTAATTEQIAAAVEAGAVMGTHLGNGAHSVLPRHPNYIWDQLADERLAISVIADGFHLPDNVLRCFLAAKGMQSVVLTSDASGLAGCPMGEYDIHGVAVSVGADRRISLTENPDLLAGSGVSMLDCVNYLVRAGLAGTADAIDMAGVTAARALGLAETAVSNRKRADFLLYHSSKSQPVDVVGTVVGGAIRYSIF